MKCYISVSRTGNSFSRVGVDMAHEQTINSEAKSSVKSITASADVASAVNRWVVTNYMINQLLNSLLKLAGLNHTTDGNTELRQSRTEKYIFDLESIKLLLRSTLIHSVVQPTNMLYLIFKQEGK